MRVSILEKFGMHFIFKACTTEFEKYVDAQDIIVTNTLEIIP